jgi:hypothetical protein
MTAWDTCYGPHDDMEMWGDWTELLLSAQQLVARYEQEPLSGGGAGPLWPETDEEAED